MWRLLSVLTLCGMPALYADVCGGLPTGFPKWAAAGWPLNKMGRCCADPKDDLHPVSFRLSVKQGGPAFRITVGAFLHELADRPIHAGDIEVARCQDGNRLQTLPIMADEPLGYASTFHADDINLDGYLDFSVVTEFTGSNGDMRSYWVYDPGTGIFIQNEFTHELRCGSVAVTSKYGDTASEIGETCWGAADIDFDPEKHEISRRYFGGAMGDCPNTGEGKGERYRVVNNRLILIHKQEFELEPKPCTVTEWDLIGGTMRITKVRRYDAQGQLVK